MATPTTTSYSVASGVTVYAGRRNRPAWRNAMAANTWATVPASNTLDSLNPKNNVTLNPNYPSNPEWMKSPAVFPGVVSAWCGGCFDTATNTLWLPLSGGHADYAGNEPYKIALNTSAPAWEMVRPPSGAIGNLLTTDDGQEASGVYSDGRPRSIHSYNKHVYVPGIGPVVSVQGNTAWSAQTGKNQVIKISPTTGEATYGAINSGTGGASGYGACYDSSRHVIWGRGPATSKFNKYDIALDTWSDVGSTIAVSGYAGLCYLPDDDCILWLCDYFTNKFAVFDCATGIVTQPSVSGSAVGALLSGRMQPHWVPSLGAVAVWDNSASTTVINTLVKPSNPRTDAWSIGQLAVAGGNTVTPTAATANGTYGRFAYASGLGGFVLLNATSQQLYFYALD
jgi:hypothetical protein